GHHSPTVRQSSAVTVILLLPVLAMVCFDIVLIYYQFAFTPSGGLSGDISHSALTNTAWLLDKISIGGGLMLLVMTLMQLFVSQSMSRFILCAVALVVHIATVFIAESAVVTPFIAVKVQDLF
ncbi:hypothetical protein, partial [Pseudomonas sp. RSP]|uniref:hypothetical protein n=1 Tax=Pseudomonas sp. RSP TaxID=3462641 RepID=UPI00405454FD